MKRLRAGFVTTFILIGLASIGTLYLVLNKLEGPNSKSSQVKAAPNCPVINGCVADHPESRCNDQGQMCTYYIGEEGYESNSSVCQTAGAQCGTTGYYCMISGSCHACIHYTECFYKNPDNCVLDESCGGAPPPDETSTPTPTPIPTLTPTPVPTPTPTPTAPPQLQCNAICAADSQCLTSFCHTSSNRCRNPLCPTRADCICSATPTPTPTLTPTPIPTPTPTLTPMPTETPVPTPNWCNGTCGSNSNCQSGYFCYYGFCRIPACADSASCSCASPTPTPVAPQVLGATAPPVLPKTGGGMESLLGLFGIGSLGMYLIRRYRLM